MPTRLICNVPLFVKSWLFCPPLSCVINCGRADIRGAEVLGVLELIADMAILSEPGVVMEAGVDGGPICGVPAQLDCRELVGVLLGDMSMSSWCSVKKIKVQSNLPYRSPLSNGHFETRPTNITI